MSERKHDSPTSRELGAYATAHVEREYQRLRGKPLPPTLPPGVLPVPVLEERVRKAQAELDHAKTALADRAKGER